MGSHPEVAAFRRFGSLNALNVHYMQAELTEPQDCAMISRESIDVVAQRMLMSMVSHSV
jgi:hypothetical protein